MIGRWSKTNLRLRLAVSAGFLTALSILVVGVAVWLAVALGLRSATDDELRNTFAAIETVAGTQGFTDGDSGADDGDGPPVFGFGSGENRPNFPFVQVVQANGVAVGEELPIDDRVLAIAAGDEGPDFDDVDFAGRTLRVMTDSIDVGGTTVALRVGSDITGIREGLGRARAASLIAGVVAGLLAAVTSWFAAGRLLAPVAAVAQAADRLRRNDELPDHLEGEGPDELGSLVGSFNDLLDDLRVSRDQQKRLVADVSHELRTPLTSLRVKIEFIQAQPELATAERARLIEGAVADLSSLGDLVSELVELASEGASPERAELVELSQLVEAEVERFGTTSGRSVELSTTPGLVETRPKAAIRALSNLLVNADKYSPAGEPIDVRQQGPRIEVRDRGDGIAVEDRERVFERFYRGDGHRAIDGTGLGLAIVASVARSNGGTTWIDDPSDGGPGVVVGLSVGPTTP